MKLSPESVSVLAARFTDTYDEKLTELIEEEIGRALEDPEFGAARDGLQDAVAEMLGTLTLADT